MKLDQLKTLFREFDENLRFEYDLKKKNWFNIGGKAKAFYKADNLKELIKFYKQIRSNVQEGYKYSKLEKSRIIWISKDICALDAVYSRFNKNYDKVFTGRGIYMYKKIDSSWKMFSMSAIDLKNKK